ncbi:hypothetical protein EY643_01575 [Halioglobus maricola]|uniref:Uncharacterized protein n=1 Tax=Halioglobus maricola TaxID=2601894 RepID=A0A5P9NF86_9GAMM|nr:hypothetical protein [Halioglobus maricola]QFU74447.1 hypothetical protein EY643_01575 [Halioglobus maricola]
MSNAKRSTTVLSCLSVLALGAAVAFYYYLPGDTPDGSQAAAAGALQGAEADMKASASRSDKFSRWPAAGEREPANTATQSTREEAREIAQMRRASRIEAYNAKPADERARIVAERWELTAEQEAELTGILARYSEQIAALGDAGLEGSDLARAQNQLQSRQMNEIGPIISDSPRMKRSKQRFMDAAAARGGTLVTD